MDNNNEELGTNISTSNVEDILIKIKNQIKNRLKVEKNDEYKYFISEISKINGKIDKNVEIN